MADAAPLAALSAAPQVLRIEGRGMLTIRADAADGPAVAAALGLPAPAPRRIVREGDRALAWMSPDEWLLMAPKADLAPDPEGHVCVGAIAGAFGVKGEVRLKSFCADPEGIAEYGPLTDAEGRTFGVRLDRPVKGGFAARLTGVKTREQAEALKGTRLYAPREALPSLPDDEYYHADLIGLEVVDPAGAPLGRVRAIHDFGAGDLLEVVSPGLKQPALVPFTREAAPTVDLASRRIVVDPPEGVFPETSGEDEVGSEADSADETDAP